MGLLREIKGLPAGWALAVDSPSKCTYFFHRPSGRSQWEWPGEVEVTETSIGDLQQWLNSDLAQQLLRSRVKAKALAPLFEAELGGSSAGSQSGFADGAGVNGAAFAVPLVSDNAAPEWCPLPDGSPKGRDCQSEGK